MRWDGSIHEFGMSRGRKPDSHEFRRSCTAILKSKLKIENQMSRIKGGHNSGRPETPGFVVSLVRQL